MKYACVPKEADVPDGSSIMNDASKGYTGLKTEYRTITTLAHPESPKALAFWDARPADGIIIGRDVPSRAIASLLSHVIVHEPIKGGSDLKVRVAGTAIRRRFGDDITGKTMADLFPTPDFPNRLQSVLTAIETDTPQLADCCISTSSFDILHSELVIMPVLAPDRVTKWGLTVVFFFG